MTTYNKILVGITLFLWMVIGILFVFKPSFYNWALWIIPVFFYILTFMILKFMEKNIEDKYLPVKFAQVSIVKLIFALGFILLFKLFLPKDEWIYFIIFSGVTYILFTIYEVKYLLSLLK